MKRYGRLKMDKTFRKTLGNSGRRESTEIGNKNNTVNHTLKRKSNEENKSRVETE